MVQDTGMGGHPASDEADDSAAEWPQPQFVGGRLLSVPRLREHYEEALDWRLTMRRARIEHSVRLDSLNGASKQEIWRSVSRMQAIEAWENVLTGVLGHGRESFSLVVGSVLAVTVPLAALSGAGTAAVVAACGVLLASILLATAAISLISLDTPRSLPRLRGVAQAVAIGCLALAALTAVDAWPLSLISIPLILLCIFLIRDVRAIDVGTDDELRALLIVVIVATAAGGVLPQVWDLDVGIGVIASLFGSLAGSLALLLSGLYVLDVMTDRRFFVASSLALLLIAAVVAAVTVAEKLPDWVDAAVTGAASAAAVAVLGAGLLLAFQNAIVGALWRRKGRTHLYDDVIDTLAAVVESIEYGAEGHLIALEDPAVQASVAAELRATADQRSDAVRADVSGSLRWAADLLARAFPRELRTRTILADTRIRDAANHMAATVWGWLYTVNMRGTAGLSLVESAVLEALPPAIRRDWEAFPKENLDLAVSRRSRAQVVSTVARGVVVSLIPLAGLLVFERLDVVVPEAAYVVAALMPLSVVLRALDPKSAEGLGMLDQALGSVRSASDAIWPHPRS